MVGHIQARPKEAHAFPTLPRRHTLAGELPCAASLDLSGWKPVAGHPGVYRRTGDMGGIFLFNAGTGFAGYQNPRLTRLSVTVFEEGCFTDALACKAKDSGKAFGIWIVFSPAGEGSCLGSLTRFAEETQCDRLDLVFPDWATGAYDHRAKDRSLRPVSVNVALDDSGFSAIWDSPGSTIWKPPFFFYDQKYCGKAKAARVKAGSGDVPDGDDRERQPPGE